MLLAFFVQLKAKEEEKVLAAKAKVQKLEAEVKQRKALRGKRVATAYILFVKEQIKTVSHLPSTERFKVRVCGAQPILEHVPVFVYIHTRTGGDQDLQSVLCAGSAEGSFRPLLCYVYFLSPSTSQ